MVLDAIQIAWTFLCCVESRKHKKHFVYERTVKIVLFSILRNLLEIALFVTRLEIFEMFGEATKIG